MTWKEFKENVEKQGLTDELVVLYIDWDDGHDPKVRLGSTWKGEPCENATVE